MSGRMRAARLVEPGRFEVETLPLPDPGPGQVLIAVEGCGLCASNVPPWEGLEGMGYPLQPGAPGHEVWGRIEEVGAGVEGLEAGTRVTALSYNGFADFDVAEADAVVPLPRAAEGRAIPGEPLACAVNVVRRAGIVKGDTVVVVGAGFLGSVTVRLARRAGAAMIIAVSRREESRRAALYMGADAVLSYEDDVHADVGAACSGDFADVVIEATGKQRPLDLAGELTRVRGRLVIAGYHQDGPRTVNMQLWNWRGLDVINAHERDAAVYVDGMREAVRLVATGELDVESLLTDEFPLERINDAFRTAASRPSGFMKAIVRGGAA